MKLERLYCNMNNFKEIEFNSGLNIILGKIFNKSDNEKDTHNLGKSTLVEIIDYMLLKGSNKEQIFEKHYNVFENYVFYLEIKVNHNKYITIRRKIADKGKASIKIHNFCNKNKVIFDIWDFEDIVIESKSKKKLTARGILNIELAFDVVDNFTYRNGLNYFLRTQIDYIDEFQLGKFKGKDSNWKPYLFNLLGFDNELLIKLYNLNDKIKLQNKIVKELEGKLDSKSNEIDKINGLIQIKEEELKKIREQLDQFNFYSVDNNINQELVNEIENDISRLNSITYNLECDISQIKESLDAEQFFSIEKIENLFKEVNIFFEKDLKRSYEDLIKFNKELTSERKEYLQIALKKKLKILEESSVELINLNDKRSKYLSIFTESDSFKKYKLYQEDLILIEKDISDLRNQLNNIDIIKNIEKEIADIKKKLEITKIELGENVERGNAEYNNIRLLFSSYLKYIINKNGLISIIQKNTGNIEYKSTILNDKTGVSTSEGKGNTYKKIMCECFDLAVLSNYSSRNYFKFVYHDGGFESLDNRKKIKYLNLINEIIEKYDLQIIITMIEDDIPFDENGKRYKFNGEDIVLILNDKSEEGTLFGINF